MRPARTAGRPDGNEQQGLEAGFEQKAGRKRLDVFAHVDSLSSQPLGDWSGIVTNDAGRVTEINLPQNLLAGELPSEVSDLTELTRLDLRRNELIGEIPDDLDDLINLDSLSLANNLLSGEIPAELGNLSNLESLSLENNQLDGDIPTGLGNLFFYIV